VILVPVAMGLFGWAVDVAERRATRRLARRRLERICRDAERREAVAAMGEWSPMREVRRG
jgi:hypothetical protein